MSLLGNIVSGILNGSNNNDEVDWYCDSCDAYLNTQSGFTTSTGKWTCQFCGAENDVTSSNILSEDEADSVKSYQQECPNCGGHMRRTWRNNEWECETCGTVAQEDDYGVLWAEDE